jgi:cytoskeletal protein CcmA (bactofilin family)
VRIIALLFLWILSLGSFVCAEELPEDSTVIRPGEVYQDDYYAVGDLVEVSGTVKGNAYLVGTQVYIDGDIEGSLFVLSGNIEISGRVHGDVWLLSGGAVVSGDLYKDIVLLAANVQFPDEGKVGGNVLLASGNAELENWTGGNVTVLASHIKISGEVNGNVRSLAGKLRVVSSALIRGNLKYKSNDMALIDPRARIEGTITYHRSIFHSLMDVPLVRSIVIGSKVAAFLMNFIYTFVMGIVIIRLFPRKLSIALNSLQASPLRAFWYGLLLLILFPLASLVLLATVIGAPFALTLIALNIVTLYTAKIFTILWLANKLFSKWRWRKNGLRSLALGQILYCILTAVPYVGPFLAFCAMVLGLGAIVVFQKN